MAKSKNVDEVRDVSALVASCDACITYVPLRTEVPLGTLLSLTPTYEIAPRASLDPRTEALHAMEAIGNKSACVLIPGRAFDAHGTRHGQGGGWYDRFLARIPRDWIRIGFCFANQYSATPLKRNSWDQPMDYVVVVAPDGTYNLVVVSSEKNHGV